MEIKGTAVKATPEYVKQFHPDQYDQWLEAMPEPARKIMEQPVYATSWYNLTDAVLIPTRKVGDLFFKGDHKEAARILGRFSSEIALQGIYKIFVRVSSPHFVLSRASNIFSAYYKPSVIKVTESKNKRCVLNFAQFHRSEELIMYRIAGWVEKTLEITLKTALSVVVENNVVGDELTTRIIIEWE